MLAAAGWRCPALQAKQCSGLCCWVVSAVQQKQAFSCNNCCRSVCMAELSASSSAAEHLWSTLQWTGCGRCSGPTWASRRGDDAARGLEHELASHCISSSRREVPRQLADGV